MASSPAPSPSVPGYPPPQVSAPPQPPAPGPPGPPDDPVDLGRRRTRRIAVAVGLAVVVLVAAGVYLIATASSTSSPETTASPAALRLARSAEKSTIDGGSFHYVSAFTSGGQTQTTVGDAGADSGKQVITIGPDTFTVLVIGGACYFQGDAKQLEDQLGLPASIAAAHAGQWISLSPGDLPYQSVYVAVTTNSALHSNVAFASLTR